MEAAAAIVVIGNEILSAKVQDSNSPWLIAELRSVGMPVARVHTIPDDVAIIAATVREAAAQFEQVITCGGVGPTLDDVTLEGIALALGVALVVDAKLEAAIRAHYGAATLPSHLKMALVPQGSQLTDPPGAIWPVLDVRNVLVLPGDPSILRRKFSSVKQRFERRRVTLHKVHLVCDEGLVAPHLDVVHAEYPGVQLGSYPSYDGRVVRVMVTFEALDAARTAACVRRFLELADPATVVGTDFSEL